MIFSCKSYPFPYIIKINNKCTFWIIQTLIKLSVKQFMITIYKLYFIFCSWNFPANAGKFQNVNYVLIFVPEFFANAKTYHLYFFAHFFVKKK
jgi:hypothetical protein